MDLIRENKKDILNFLGEHAERFEESLLKQAVNVRDKIKEIDAIGNINLLNNARTLVTYIVEEDSSATCAFAAQEGEIWAKNKLTLAFKLEWIQAIRRTFWEFIKEYSVKTDLLQSNDDFFVMQGKIDGMVDLFINNFFISYSTCKDELIEKQRKMVDNLSVPMIPISDMIFILPLIGTLDDQRARIIEEKVLMEIGKSKVHTLIMDLSGIAETSPESIHYFSKLMEAIRMMGCKPIITGLRPNMVQQMIRLDTSHFKDATKATLQQALHDSLFAEKVN